ncbi:cell envelope-associated transcriptional attenuator LytR-CpsA-Psr [Geminocystis sp. NIES-3708]|uniref:LCP family protein n=1 Tax=Geminocystis sp. NIES-3708 TaxID=1615909 RepID=UPI0005FC3E59|nr:LCP family protein [Geminocystis sp. NIES-3708]BAQ61858.1 cell envelope-associated transcriptional attenuator LytR-CpsA-Psr [Geminocystis sp. NIES-3708]
MSEGNFSRKGKFVNRQQFAKISTSTSKNVSKSNPHWLLIGFGLSAIAVLSATVGAILALSLSNTPLRQARLTPAEEAVFNQEETVSFDNLQIPKLSRPVNILVMGIKVTTDDVPDQSTPDVGYHALVNSFEGLSDSMLLLRFDPEKDYVTVLSIPRDTKTLVEGRGITKINDANFHGGPALAAESVSNLLDDVQIDRYIRINVQGVEKFIDALGGVNLYVPQNMKYTDHSQHLYIDLKEGQQHLDGAKALQFLRFRYDAYGDIGRVQRQQVFMRALIEQALNPRTILRMPDILSVVRAHLDTNLTTNELIAIAGFTGQKNRSNINMVMLPGDFNTPEEGELSYWLPNHEKISEIMAQHFQIEPDYYTASHESDPTKLKIAVQSNKDNQETAQKVVDYLRETGYNRVFLSQQFANQPLLETKIVAQQGDNYSAAQIRADLGVGEVIVESTGVLTSDITIQVGQDWTIPEFNHHQDGKLKRI